MNLMRVDTVSDIADFERLRTEWESLVSTSRAPQLCLAHDWLAAWWQAFDGRGSRVAAPVAREGDRAVAPGFVLQTVLMEHLFQAPQPGVYDMLPPAVEYKLRWSQESVEQVSVRLFGRTPRGRLAHLLQGRLRPLLRRFALLRHLKKRTFGD